MLTGDTGWWAWVVFVNLVLTLTFHTVWAVIKKLRARRAEERARLTKKELDRRLWEVRWDAFRMTAFELGQHGRLINNWRQQFTSDPVYRDVIKLGISDAETLFESIKNRVTKDLLREKRCEQDPNDVSGPAKHDQGASGAVPDER